MVNVYKIATQFDVELLPGNMEAKLLGKKKLFFDKPNKMISFVNVL